MERRRAFFLARVAVLLAILFGVVLYAVRDVRSRHARTDWTTTLDVAVVLVHLRGTSPVDEAAVSALHARVPALEARLSAEKVRAAPSGVAKPFSFHVVGPVEIDAAAPVPSGEGFLDLAGYALDLRAWLGAVDPAAGIVTSRFARWC